MGIFVTIAIPALPSFGVPVGGMREFVEVYQRGPTDRPEARGVGGERLYEWVFNGHIGQLVHRRDAGPLALVAAVLQAVDREVPRFTCPRCWRTSWNPTDRAEGYCGACHEHTGTPGG